jgi:multidrug resistance protein
MPDSDCSPPTSDVHIDHVAHVEIGFSPDNTDLEKTAKSSQHSTASPNSPSISSRSHGPISRAPSSVESDPNPIPPPSFNPTTTNTSSLAGPVHSVFTTSQKRFIVFMASWAGFFSPVSGQIYFPALNSLAADLHVSNTLINLTLTSYMIFQGLAPMFIGDLADTMGRRPAYIICFVIFIVANIGLACQNSYGALFVLRCLQSSGSSGTIAMASGVVGDVATAAERGSYMGYTLAGSLLGPALGPVLGGLLSQFLGWRSIFWFLTIMGSTFLVVLVIFFPETGIFRLLLSFNKIFRKKGEANDCVTPQLEIKSATALFLPKATTCP